MRRLISSSILILTLASCASTGSQAQNNNNQLSPALDGSSTGKAIIINAKNESEGVPMEYQWISARYPGFKRGGQSLLMSGGKSYDKIDITTADGQKKSLYFDITSFFGKL
ncbi:hypothetical protein [Solilutibacter silvestris]|uniref:hypothetical protein n=1 Tax=Solilutibacter silvestris TaxID=1645665 RepID=UPI00101ADBE1|nr:hypothetical protein [Lysobacter silvestris]